jgi:predicted transport protein
LSEGDHTGNLSDQLKPIWTTLREKLESYADTSFFITKGYISWKRDNTAVCFIHFRKKELRIDVLRGNIREDQSKSKGFFTLDDPKEMAEEGGWKWKSGQSGHDYKIRLKNQDASNYVMFLLEQKYNSLG